MVFSHFHPSKFILVSPSGANLAITNCVPVPRQKTMVTYDTGILQVEQDDSKTPRQNATLNSYIPLCSQVRALQAS